LFTKIESAANREAIGLAMYRELRKAGKSIEFAREAAKELSNTVHGDMSPENLPLLAQKGGPLVRTALALQRFTLHQWNYMFNRFMQKEYRPLGRFLVTQMVLGGLVGVPIFNSINDLMERKYGKSAILAVKQYIYEQMRDNPDGAQVVDDIITRGIPAAALGIDISRNIATTIPYLFEEGDSTIGENLGGIYSAYYKNVGLGIDRIQSGQTLKGLSMMGPSMGGDIAKAYLGRTEGYKNIKGEPLVDSKGKPILLSPLETAAQATGFTPSRVGKARQLRASERNLIEYLTDKKTILGNRVRNAEADGDTAGADEAREELKAFLSKFHSLYPGLDTSKGKLKIQSMSRETRKKINFEQKLQNIP